MAEEKKVDPTKDKKHVDPSKNQNAFDHKVTDAAGRDWSKPKHFKPRPGQV